MKSPLYRAWESRLGEDRSPQEEEEWQVRGGGGNFGKHFAEGKTAPSVKSDERKEDRMWPSTLHNVQPYPL